MADESINEFDYSLPWWRRIVEHSEALGGKKVPEEMYNLTKTSIDSLLESSQKLHAALVSSVAWVVIKDDPVIVNWIFSLNDLETQVKAARGEPAEIHVPIPKGDNNPEVKFLEGQNEIPKK